MNKDIPSLAEADVLRALAGRHGRDAFFTKVKTGPTWGLRSGGLRIIDALAIKKSWVNELVTAYEVKVSKGDFNSDEKWVEYLEFCHRFYFATPARLVSKAEVAHADAGLVWVYESGAARVIKQAPRRKVELPDMMFQYLVYSQIASDRWPFFSGPREYLEAWIEDKADRRNLGWRVGTKMAERLQRLEDGADVRLARAFRAFLKEHDISIYAWEEELGRRLKFNVPSGIRYRLEQVWNAVRSLSQELDPNAPKEWPG